MLLCTSCVFIWAAKDELLLSFSSLSHRSALSPIRQTQIESAAMKEQSMYQMILTCAARNAPLVSSLYNNKHRLMQMLSYILYRRTQLSRYKIKDERHGSWNVLWKAWVWRCERKLTAPTAAKGVYQLVFCFLPQRKRFVQSRVRLRILLKGTQCRFEEKKNQTQNFNIYYIMR